MSPVTDPVFGRLVTAMVTPFTADGALDTPRCADLARRLVDEQLNDALVVNGTTGESPTTSNDEKQQAVRAVVEAVGDRAHVVAGVGSADTAHSIELAQQAAESGADGLLVVTPYYSRPTQAGVIAHFTAVADATELPLMVYDIPHRAGIAITQDTLIELAQHPRIVAVKDAKGDVVSSSRVMAETDLQYYSGDDGITLALLSQGAVGVVGTSTHFSGVAMKQMIDAWVAGDTARALELHRRWLAVFTGVFAAPGCCTVKGALAAEGFDVGGLRMPMMMPERGIIDHFITTLNAARAS